MAAPLALVEPTRPALFDPSSPLAVHPLHRIGMARSARRRPPLGTVGVAVMSTGMPQGIWLAKFGVIIRDYFGHVPYQVGSSLDTKDWRDVDVRLILPDDEFERRFGRVQNCSNKKLAAITLAFCALGSAMTGLPIDFQIQPESHANEAYPGTRSALLEVDPS